MSIENTKILYENEVISLTSALSALGDKKSGLEEQQSDIEQAIVDLETEMDNLLEDKRNEIGSDYIRFGSTYGTDNLSDWMIFGTYMEGSDVEYVSSYELKLLNGDYTADFSTGSYLLFDCGVDGYKEGYVSLVTYSTVTDDTSISLNSGNSEEITSNLYGVLKLTYQYEGTGWDNDEDIDQGISDFDELYDLLHKDLDINGTYGIIASISQVDDAIGLLNANKDKYSTMINILDRLI